MGKPKYKGVAEHMRDVLVENGSNRIMWGDVGFLDQCARRSIHTTLMQQLPRVRHDRILNALDKSPLFRKAFVDSDTGVTHRATGKTFWRKTVIRVFTLKEGQSK